MFSVYDYTDVFKGLYVKLKIISLFSGITVTF